MPKMRGFKPELWTDDKFVDLTPLARLLFMGMWTYACDNGHLDDKPKQIKMRILPTDDVDAEELIREMVDLGMVMRENGALTVRKLREHQRIDDRYFTWCDRCEHHEIPERAREKHGVHTSGTRSAPTGTRVSTPGTHVEGRKEGRKEGEGESESSAAGKPAKKPSRRLPPDWYPTVEHLDRATASGVVLRNEVEKFKAHAEANDRRQVNWNAAFTQWLLNARPMGNVRPLSPRDPRLAPGEGPDDWMRSNQ